MSISHRISRLAQPRKYSTHTPLTVNKNRSSSTENIASHNRPVNKRSQSATPRHVGETPIRPPIARSLSGLFTPGSTNKSVAARKPVTEQVARILDVIRQQFGPTYLSAGLQSMSAKQFVDILKFFANQICGDKIVIHDNNVDDVKRFVDFIGYPHQMNKSWFKAPTVSIAYDRNVEFLDWLCDFVSTDENIADEVENQVVESADFAGPQFTTSFLGDVKNGYLLWNSEDRAADFDEFKSNWTSKLITARTNIIDIDASTAQVENEFKVMQTSKLTYGKEGLLQTQQKKCADLGEEVNKLKASIAEKNADFQATSNDLNHETHRNQALKRQIYEMRETIKNQAVSDDGRKELAAEKEGKKHLVNEKRAFVASIKLIEEDFQVKVARLKNQKTSKIFDFNSHVQKLFQYGIDFDGITMDQMSIHENDTKERIKTKLELFVQIKEIVNKRRTELHTSLPGTQAVLTSISNELFKIEDEVHACQKHLHSMEVRIQKIENEISDETHSSEQLQRQLQIKIDNLMERYEQINSKIKHLEKVAESLKEENKKILHGIEVKANELLAAKRERQERREEALLELEQLVDQLNDVVENNEE